MATDSLSMPDQYAVFGYPIAHSKSPLIHGEFARQTRQTLTYRAIEVPPDGFAPAVRAFCASGGKGFNVTVPFKREAWQLVDRHQAAAATAQAVNTVLCDHQGLLHGFNTDGSGLVLDLRQNHGLSLRGMEILILGAGGSAAGILGPLAEAQPARLVVANRTASKAEQLVRQLTLSANITACGLEQLAEEIRNGFDLIINATSSSLQNQVPDLPAGVLARGGCTYDLMYGDAPTAFVTWGQTQGAALALDGLGMLVEQAAEAFAIWRGIRPATKPILRLLRPNQGV